MDHLETFLISEIKNTYHLIIRAECALENINKYVHELRLDEFSQTIPTNIKQIKTRLKDTIKLSNKYLGIEN